MNWRDELPLIVLVAITLVSMLVAIGFFVWCWNSVDVSDTQSTLPPAEVERLNKLYPNGWWVRY